MRHCQHQFGTYTESRLLVWHNAQRESGCLLQRLEMLSQKERSRLLWRTCIASAHLANCSDTGRLSCLPRYISMERVGFLQRATSLTAVTARSTSHPMNASKSLSRPLLRDVSGNQQSDHGLILHCNHPRPSTRFHDLAQLAL